MIGFYNDTGTIIAEGFAEITVPVVGIPVPDPVDSTDETPTDTSSSDLPTLRVFREKFTGKSFVRQNGGIVMEGELDFGFSEQIGTAGVCWVRYDVTFTKH